MKKEKEPSTKHTCHFCRKIKDQIKDKMVDNGKGEWACRPCLQANLTIFKACAFFNF